MTFLLDLRDLRVPEVKHVSAPAVPIWNCCPVSGVRVFNLGRQSQPQLQSTEPDLARQFDHLSRG